MNDWERLHRQAERYKQSYPPGTRVAQRKETQITEALEASDALAV